MMLHDMLINQRENIIARCHAKVFHRQGHLPATAHLLHGIPNFLDQLTRTLELEHREGHSERGEISGSASGTPQQSELNVSASQHGKDLLGFGFTIDQLVHNYGDMCQAITDLAIELGVSCTVAEFRTLNRCMDNAIADAATEFTYQRDGSAARKMSEEAAERLSDYSHQLRTTLSTALMAFEAAKTGQLMLDGATGAILERNLRALTLLIEQSLTDNVAIANEPRILNSFSVAGFIGEVTGIADRHALEANCTLRVLPVSSELAISGDRDLLRAAVVLVLQNAFRFSQPGGEVLLTAYAGGKQVIIDVKDQSAQWPDAGMNMAIVQRAVMSNDGILSFQQVPGDGRVLTISLPRYALPT